LYIFASIPTTFFMENYLAIFIIALISLGLTVLLRSITAIVIQGALVFFFYFTLIESTVILVVASAIQVVITAVILYKMFKAITFNYTLVLEKTHELKPNHTVTLDKATRFSFWHTK